MWPWLQSVVPFGPFPSDPQKTDQNRARRLPPLAGPDLPRQPARYCKIRTEISPGTCCKTCLFEAQILSQNRPF